MPSTSSKFELALSILCKSTELSTKEAVKVLEEVRREVEDLERFKAAMRLSRAMYEKILEITGEHRVKL